MGGTKPVTVTDRRWKKWVEREAPIVLPPGDEAAAAAAAAAPPPRRAVLSSTGHTPRRATGKLTPIPVTTVANRRLQPSPEPLQPWSETELLTDWVQEEKAKALDYYSQGSPPGMMVLQAGIAAQTEPVQASRYVVLQTSPSCGASLDFFAPEAWMKREAPRGQLPAAHAEVQRTGRRVSVTVHAGLHPDAPSAGSPVTFEWEVLSDAQQWEGAIKRAGAASESAASREAVAQHAAREAEVRRQQQEAAERLEREAEEIRARRRAEAEARATAAASAAQATLSATAAAATELVEKHRSRARLEPPTVHAIADGRHPSVDDLGSRRGNHMDVAEARDAIADLRAAYHLRGGPRQPEQEQRPVRAAPRVNEAARRKQREAAERRKRREQAQGQRNRQVTRQLEVEKREDAAERAARWGPCRDGDACTRADCKYSHPREFERKKAAIQHAKRAHEEARSAMWKAEQPRRVAADFRMGLKLGLKKPLLLPGAEDRIDPDEARRAIERLKAKYHPHLPKAARPPKLPKPQVSKAARGAAA